jgi:magnesium transporter
LRQAQETTNIYSDILTGTMDAYASVISNNMNNIMKQMTSISIILMIPYGNCQLLQDECLNGLQDYPMGLWVLVLVSIILSTFGVFLFKEKMVLNDKKKRLNNFTPFMF